jgi:hypothetical protein
MELDSIKSQIKMNMIDKVNDVLSGTQKSVNIHYVRPGDVLKYLKKFNDDEEPETNHECNGWQWDFWISFKIKDKTYQLSGDGYYQDYLTFSLSIEEE